MNTRLLAFLRNTRFWLAGPVALLLAIFVMASLSLVLPAGNGGINHLIIPIILFPFIWALTFFYPLLDSNKKRVTILMSALLLISGSISIASIMGLLA